MKNEFTETYLQEIYDAIQGLNDEWETLTNEPYIMEARLIVERVYNPQYGDQRMCECGHPYYRHFDSYDNNEPVGCKYCKCYTFVEKTNDIYN